MLQKSILSVSKWGAHGGVQLHQNGDVPKKYFEYIEMGGSTSSGLGGSTYVYFRLGKTHIHIFNHTL